MTNSSTSSRDWNRLLSDSDFIYEYDDQGRLTKKSDKDGNGDADPNNFTAYTWDHRGLLLKVATTAGGVETQVVEYGYDVSGRRTSRRVTVSGSVTEAAITHYEGQNRIAEFDVLTGSANEDKIVRHYLFGTGPNEVLAVDQGGDTAWAFHDQLGSVGTWGTHDGSAWSLQHQSFDAFGNVDGQTDDLAIGELPTVWAGHPFDAAVGLYHMQARWYDPRSGQFISLDPTRFGAGDTNLYRYAGNNPTNSIDPNGLQEVGQHWITQAEFGKRLDKISEQALEIFQTYTTPTGFNFHGNDSFFFGNAVTTHPQYSTAVGELLDAYDYIDDKAAAEIIGFIGDESLLLKKYKQLGISLNSVETISRYKQGFLENIDIATSISGEFRKANFGEKNLHLKRLAQIISVGENPSEEVAKEVLKIEERLSREAKNVLKDLRIMRATDNARWARFLKKGEGVGAGRFAKIAKGLGYLGPILVAFDARRGFAGEGHHPHLDGFIGAGDEAIYRMMFGEEIEGALRPVGEAYDNALENAMNNLNRRRFGFVAEQDSTFRAFLNDDKMPLPNRSTQQSPQASQTKGPNLYWYYLRRNFGFVD